MKSVIIEPEAEADLDAACSWFATESESLRLRFIDAVQTAIDKAAERPSSFPFVHSMTRRVIVAPFAYLMLFQERDEAIIVLGFMHAAMDPDRFLRRSR